MDSAQLYEEAIKAAGAECKAAALDYIRRGWSALALCPPDHWAVGRTHGKDCKSPGKVPIGSWKAFQSRLATEIEILDYWKTNPTLNVGMALGPVSSLIGVDVDGEEGESAIRQASGGDLPPTLEFTSGAGRRLLYRIPTGANVRPTHRAAGEKHSGYSLLGEGSQTVMPPSRHANGRKYEWVTGRGPGEIIPATAPRWLLDAMAAPSFIPEADRCLDPAEYIEEGKRDRTLISFAGVMRHRGMDEDAIFAALTVTNEKRCVPPLTEADIRRISKSASRYEPDAAAGMTIKFPSANGQPNGQSSKDSEPVWHFILDDRPIVTHTESELAIESSSTHQHRKSVRLYSMPKIIATSFPEPRWVVAGLLSEGLNLLAGKPKLGKSMMALNLALTVAGGGMALGNVQTEVGDVLYLALEDHWHRLKSRGSKMLRGLSLPPSDRLQIATSWPNQQQGGIRALDVWFDRVKKPTLVIIDVFAKFRPELREKGSAYQQDYRHLSDIKERLNAKGCTGLVLVHTRKAKADDVLEEISGTTGMSGAADGIVVLARNRGQNDAEIVVTGRDVEEQKLALRFDNLTLTWKSLGDAAEQTQSRYKQAILNVFKATSGSSYFPGEMANLLNMDPNIVKTTMWRMANEGLLQKINSKYSWPVDHIEDEQLESEK